MRQKIKKSIICKNVGDFIVSKEILKTHVPKAGDMGVFRVLEIGKHSAIQGVNGNNCYIFPGDKIMAAFGNRYATDQLEGFVPKGYKNVMHILGKGGAVGEIKSMHQKIEPIGPTKLRLLGYVTNEAQEVINSKNLYLLDDYVPFINRSFKVILSLGASMDSGKTTTAGFLARGLKAAKKKVAYVKLTGTVYTKDKHFAKDCGADVAYDFSDFGFPSTYLCDIEELLNLYESLIKKVSPSKPDYVIVEIADGLFQRETEMLIHSQRFMASIDCIVFSAAESLAINHGLQILKKLNKPVIGTSGLFTTSPLLVEEVTKSCSQPVLMIEDLSSKSILDLVTTNLGNNSIVDVNQMATS